MNIAINITKSSWTPILEIIGPLNAWQAEEDAPYPTTLPQLLALYPEKTTEHFTDIEVFKLLLDLALIDEDADVSDFSFTETSVGIHVDIAGGAPLYLLRYQWRFY